MKGALVIMILLSLIAGCEIKNTAEDASINKQTSEKIFISREVYTDQLYGFWLGQCIGNWTGLVTEMDKIGNVGAIKTGAFYTRDDWGKPDLPNIWSGNKPSDLSSTIDFVLRDPSEVWGADDDTDIEYMYQHLLYKLQTPILTAQEIRDGWMTHILPEEENYLWVSNQTAFDLMKTGMLPPGTGDPANNEHFNMIDAQLTTEIFGLFAPARMDIALQIAELPIQTTARADAEYIAQFYVAMHALAVRSDPEKSMEARIQWMAKQARQVLPDNSYTSKMVDYTEKLFQSGIPWEDTRDSIYFRYQVYQKDGYNITSKNLYCNGCAAAGINFAASLVSLFYGAGDFKETIKIGTLAGWDSDNPTATWGGLLGFMIGKKGIEESFGQEFSNKYFIHRTRQNFPHGGMDTFEQMALKGVSVVDRVVSELIGGTIDLEKNVWIIPVRSTHLK